MIQSATRIILVSALLTGTVNAECRSGCAFCNGWRCTHCESSYYLSSGYCWQCPENCTTCDSFNECTSCKPNTWGLRCQQNCNVCKDGQCGFRECTLGCKSGYYENNTSSETLCSKCFVNCKTCERFNFCNDCNDGYYLDVYTSWGETYARCSFCPWERNCKTCKFQINSALCTTCNDGFELDSGSCKQKKSKISSCSRGCSSACDEKGECLGGCNAGWTGDKCMDKCPSQCLRCFKNTANLCEECNGDFYTTSCKVQCSLSCAKVSGQTTCRIHDGYCLNGCEKKLWGPFCNLSCSNGCVDDGLSKVCERDNGTCRHGCSDGFVGDMCEKPMTRKFKKEVTKTRSETRPTAVTTANKGFIDGTTAKTVQKGDSNAIIIGAGAGGGVILLILIVVLVLRCLKRRRKPSRDRLDNGMMSNIVTLPGTSDDIQDEKEIKVPTADTYYNTASLIRSRIHVSNLLEYVKLKTDYEQEFEKLPKGLTRPCKEALKPENISKNRYNGVYAYDATRVKLESQIYINANYIDGHEKFPEYIASLGPTNAAMKLDIFWEMIWQERTEKIVMLTNLEESGRMKCEQYWPNQGEKKSYSDYNVSCTTEKKFSEFVVRDFTISLGSETRNVSQYHYIAWPDKTVPATVASLMEFRDKVEQTQTTEAGLMVVHCSAGIGRTGTYIALDILVREGREEGSVDIFGRVAALRGQRVHMVQNPEQYRFLHHCVVYALTCDPQPLSNTALAQVMTLDRMSAQYQTFMELQITPRTDRKSVATHNNRKENRKAADIPGDENRVRLTFTKHDYTNAVYVDGYLKSDEFIIAQTPLPNTVEDFVSMLYQEECPCVVCLDEEHINEKTVGQYLPPANKVSRFGQFQVACTSSNSTEDFVTRELKISRTGSSTNKEASVLHYQFRGWRSSEKVPISASSLLNLVSDIKESRTIRGSEHPTVVHCLTGAERSGIFCVVSILLEKLSVEKAVSVLNTVCQVCCRRCSAFQDLEHLRFCYACVKEMLEIPVSNVYYNA